MIRPAVPADRAAIVAMGVAFHATSPYAGLIAVTEAALGATVDLLLSSETGEILVAVEPGGALVGMIGLACYLHPLSAELSVAELAWWVTPAARGRAGLRLLRDAEAWATARGAVRLQMIAPDPRTERMYERLGYTRVEVSYQKFLQGVAA